jgi:hypothetical protein
VEPTDFANESLSLLAPLGPILYRAMEPSIEEARDYLAGRRFDGYVFADLTRYHTCSRLEESTLPPGIVFTRLPNNGMLLRCAGSQARVWKADEGGELQGPGTSKSKQAYFVQDNLFTQDPRAFRFAILWQYDFETGLLSLSLACPKQFDEQRPWNKPECHFYIPFQHAILSVSADAAFSAEQPSEDIDLKPKRKVQESDENERND